MIDQNLPAVAGRLLLGSHADFQRRCLVLIAEEQEKVNPQNILIDALCNAVRLSREMCDLMSSTVPEKTTIGTVIQVIDYGHGFLACDQPCGDRRIECCRTGCWRVAAGHAYQVIVKPRSD